MDWLILILGVPAILIPLVLLFGFAGCAVAHPCTDDGDCPAGMRCVDGMCVDASLANTPLSAPQNLVAVAIDDSSVSLTWINTDPAATDFRIERAPEDGEFAAIPAPADLSPAGATDASGLQEGVTYIYRVLARLEAEVSEPSDTASATVIPAAPVNLVATPVSINQIDLSWNNASATATEFSLEHGVPNAAFAELIPRPTGTTLSHSGLGEGTRHEYRVSAIVVDGFQNDVPQEVKSAPSATVSATTFTAAFTAPPGTLTTDQTGMRGDCVVLRLSQTLLAAGGTQVRMRLRASTTRSLTLDRLTISQPAATGDPYDAAPDLTDLATGLTIPPNTAVTVGPVNYTLDPTQDLLIAFDISNTTPAAGTRFGPLTGCDSYIRPTTAEASVQDRTIGYAVTPNTIYLIETIEVL
ncbi:MAG TPA: fibronectin type III domain-containing protein [Methyloceanibacter sp.]|nr:fibronectin type III domain-containing protein [Methyloceanibacter sp.]